MADKKISALTGATTPLAGTEVLPIVQGSATVKVSVANLTAGRAVAMAGGSFTDNITQSTAAKGVNFTANTPAAGMTSQLLNSYEEGTFTPTLYLTGTTPTITYTLQSGRYVKIGKLVFVGFKMDISVVTGAQSGGVRLNVPVSGLNVPDHYMAGGVAWYNTAVIGSNGFLSVEVGRLIDANGTGIQAGGYYGSLVYEAA